MSQQTQKSAITMCIKWLGPVLLISSGFIFFTSSMPKSKPSGAINRVVIDAGHGGTDPGNLGTGRYKVTEKTIALNVALKVGSYIEKAFPDVEVLYTRKDDSSVALHERTKFANTKGADLFISVHCDAFTKSSAIGAGSYVMGPAKTEANLRMAKKENAAILLEKDNEDNYDGFDPNSPEGLIELSLRQNSHIHQSLKFAKRVQDQFRTRVGRTDRGVRQAPFWVISFTTMPSILVELGFLTNQEEEDFLISEQGQDYMASAIYRAFKEHKTEIESIEAAVEHTAPVIEDKEPLDKESLLLEASDVIFKVQLASSSKPVELAPKNFKGLENVSEYRENDLYKYLYGSTSSYEGAKNLQKTARKTGFKGAFVVAFDREMKRIALDEALKLTKPN